MLHGLNVFVYIFYTFATSNKHQFFQNLNVFRYVRNKWYHEHHGNISCMNFVISVYHEVKENLQIYLEQN